MPLLPFQWNSDVVLATLADTPKIAEIYIPLWWHSAGSYSNTGTVVSAGTYFMTFGTNYSTGSSSLDQVYTHSTQWPATVQFALEGCMYGSVTGASSGIALYDFTLSAVVSGSTVSVTSTTPTVARSGTFNLIPGHVYGVTCVTSGGTSPIYFAADVSLVAFP